MLRASVRGKLDLEVRRVDGKLSYQCSVDGGGVKGLIEEM